MALNKKKGEVKIDIRCKEAKTKTEFKAIASKFGTYEDVIKWVNKNYEVFEKIIPPHPVKGGVL